MGIENQMENPSLGEINPKQEQGKGEGRGEGKGRRWIRGAVLAAGVAAGVAAEEVQAGSSNAKEIINAAEAMQQIQGSANMAEHIIAMARKGENLEEVKRLLANGLEITIEADILLGNHARARATFEAVRHVISDLDAERIYIRFFKK